MATLFNREVPTCYQFLRQLSISATAAPSKKDLFPWSIRENRTDSSIELRFRKANRPIGTNSEVCKCQLQPRKVDAGARSCRGRGPLPRVFPPGGNLQYLFIISSMREHLIEMVSVVLAQDSKLAKKESVPVRLPNLVLLHVY